jgi:predicted nuclease of restriction endonuclease-like (RecB) superfamily
MLEDSIIKDIIIKNSLQNETAQKIREFVYEIPEGRNYLIRKSRIKEILKEFKT